MKVLNTVTHLVVRYYKRIFHRRMRDLYPPNEYPFSNELYAFMENHPEAEAALKLSNPKRFITLPLIFTSGLPVKHPRSADQVIGVWYYDRAKSHCRFHNRVCNFKQDFIVNVGMLGKEYVVYTADKNSPPYSRPISSFFKDYGSNGKFYHDGNKEWNHHYETSKDLPAEPKLKQLAYTIEANNP